MDINEIVQTKRAREYAINMRPVLNRKALFSDETANYQIGRAHV